MTFGEKLDLLMNITHTTNSALARSIAMDASFVSRLRRGVRTPARNANYIQTIAAYFSRNCSAEYQKSALWEAMRTTSQLQPQDIENVIELIHPWLVDKTPQENNSIEDFLEGVSHFKFKKAAAVTVDEIDRMSGKAASNGEALYGVEGKQKAVLTFLSLVLKNKNPQTLLLYSDEDLEWLTANRDFTVKWAMLLAQVIRNGNQIKIIHTVNRGFDEMLSAIREWVPIYMTGVIEPFYYPKSRDGLFRRTLFIAPDTAAVSSTSVGSRSKNAANFLFTDKKIIQALLEEYYVFLSLCRPLMRIFTPCNQSEYLPLLYEFENEGADTIIKTDGLANTTMPIDVAESILARAKNADTDKMLANQHQSIARFVESLQEHHITEIIPRPDLEKVQSGKAMANFSFLLGETALAYTPAEFSRHLRNMIGLLQTYENYHVHISRNILLNESLLYVKEDVGVLVGKSSLPAVVFAINESNMTAAFWDYMKVILKKESNLQTNRQRTIAELEAIAASLEKA